MNNPKQAVSDTKPQLQLIPPAAEIAEAAALEYGAFKAPRTDGVNGYGVNNWRADGINLCTYIGACLRHLNAIKRGEDIDPKSGLPHWWHIRANTSIVIDAAEHGMLTDDRYCDDRPTDKGSEPVELSAGLTDAAERVRGLRERGQSVHSTTQENAGETVRKPVGCAWWLGTQRCIREMGHRGDCEFPLEPVVAPDCPHCHQPAHARGTPCVKALEAQKAIKKHNAAMQDELDRRLGIPIGVSPLCTVGTNRESTDEEPELGHRESNR